MRLKTSVSLSSEVLEQVGHYSTGGERSEFVEKALWTYVERLRQIERDSRDLEIIREASVRLNEEALDTLSYQAPL